MAAVIRFLSATACLAVAVAAIGWSRPGLVPRDVAYAPGLPEDAVDIVVFGTSLSAPPQTWPDHLAKSLSRCLGQPVSVERFVHVGMGSAWATAQADAVGDHDPDVILVEFAINDADILDGVSLVKAGVQHRALIAGLRQAVPGAVIILMTMNPAMGPRGWIRPWLADHYGRYHQLAVEAHVGLIDLYPRWMALEPVARGLEHDGLHPDPRVASDFIVPIVTKYLMADQECQ